MPQYVTGVGNVLRALGRARAATDKAIAVSLEKYGQVILKKALYYCPIETGALRRSHILTVSGSGKGTRVEVSAGGPEAPYALYVHEDLTKHHAPPTCAQWITRAVRETRGTGARMLKREIEARPVYTKVTEGGEVL